MKTFLVAVVVTLVVSFIAAVALADNRPVLTIRTSSVCNVVRGELVCVVYHNGEKIGSKVCELNGTKIGQCVQK